MFYSYAEFKQKYALNVDFITYTGCVASIKKYIAKLNVQINDNVSKEINSVLDRLCLVQRGARSYYDILMSCQAEQKCCLKWNQKLNCEISWKKVFCKVQKIKDIRLKWFQIRIIHRILATNVVLKEMGIVDDHKCTFCNYERDSIEHFLWRCENIKKFWSELEKVFNEKCPLSYNLRLNENIVLFGTSDGFESVCQILHLQVQNE